MGQIRQVKGSAHFLAVEDEALSREAVAVRFKEIVKHGRKRHGGLACFGFGFVSNGRVPDRPLDTQLIAL